VPENGPTYAVLATTHRGRSVRIIVDARFGNVLAIQRVIAVIPPGAYPTPQPVDRRAATRLIRLKTVGTFSLDP